MKRGDRCIILHNGWTDPKTREHYPHAVEHISPCEYRQGTITDPTNGKVLFRPPPKRS